MDSLLEALQSGAAFRRKRGPRQGKYYLLHFLRAGVDGLPLLPEDKNWT